MKVKNQFEARPDEKTLTIERVGSAFEREPLVRPYGFKGGALTELWQAVSMVSVSGGAHGIGVGTQSVLWSDPAVWENHSEEEGNRLMYRVTERALQMIRGQRFRNPVQVQEDLLDELHAYARQVTGRPGLRETFTLNALVGVDNALWVAYAAANGIGSFDEMIPAAFRPALSHRHHRVAATPVVGYAMPLSEVNQLVGEGYFLIKIKLGQPGAQADMLEKDKARLTELHDTLADARTPHTSDGRVAYYLDPNGRYESRETMMRLLDHARRIGAFDRILILEEPYAEALEIDVRDLGVRVAADETAHTDRHALARIEMGYGAIALKPVAKTLSMSMKVARLAHERDIPCFCADLTANPILAEWNKAVSARLAPFPGMAGNLGLMESNGHQNYAGWERMMGYNPASGASWTEIRNGVYELTDEYYARNGGLFDPPAHYERMFASPR